MQDEYITRILAAKSEAKRFNDAANELLLAYNEQRKSGIHFPNAPKQSGALKRASMDLTRSLAVLRRPR